MKRGSVVIICLVLISILSISIVSASLLTDIRNFFQNLFDTGDDENLEGELAARPASCTDSDGGLAYTIYGTCTDSLKKINDSCVIGGTYNGQLAESYCQQKSCYTQYYNCASTGRICSNGKCITSCTPESNATFCTRLGKSCGSVTNNDNCGTPRTVNCGTCSSGYYCNSTGKCVLNVTCTNDCSPSGSKRCSGSYSQTCGNYDADSCLEWNNTAVCTYGCNISTGNCNPVPVCTNECSTSGQKICDGNGYKTCGNYDADSCLEWSSVTNCLTGQTCSGGNCIASGLYAGLVSWWKMNEVVGGKIIDSQGGYNGTLMNDSHIGSDIVRGNVLKTDGSYDYVNIGAFDKTENLTEFTISIWIKAAVADDNATRYVFYKGSNMYMYRLSSEYYYFALYNDTSVATRGTLLAPKDTNWHHIAVIYNGTNVYTYIDMNKSALTKFSGDTRQTTSSFTISMSSLNSAFNGSIDDFMFFERALSADEVNTLYINQSIKPICTDECSVSGQKICSGSGYKTCGNYDADYCLEWSSVTNCLATEICESGTCIPFVLDFNCKPLKYNNQTLASHINLVFVPSGFNGDMNTFKQKAEWVFSSFSQYEPFSSSITKYNAFYVPIENGDYCYFNCSGIDRLLCCDTYIAKNISSKCTNNIRQTVVIENSMKYGGAGYIGSDVATTSINTSAPKIAVHELGHSLFELADEYTSGGGTPLYPNCDYAGCPKWSNMIGYNGVNCVGTKCANGLHFASENTIMLELDYKFEEVNLRQTCCMYYRDTGTYPYYCSQFNQFTTSGDLNEFCQVSPPGEGGVPIEIPHEYVFLQDNLGNWKLESTTLKNKGIYPREKVFGEGKGNIKVIITKKNGKQKELRFDDYENVEYPLDTKNLGGYVKQLRKSISIIVDASDGKVKDIKLSQLNGSFNENNVSSSLLGNIRDFFQNLLNIKE